MKKPGCLGRTCGSQIICAPCGLTWDIDDKDPPDCQPRNGIPLSPITVIKDLLEAVEGLLKHYGNVNDGHRDKIHAYVRAKAAQNNAKGFLQ